MRLSFVQKESDLYPELRPSYKIPQIVLILGISSRGNKSSLIRLHFFSYALSNSGRRDDLLNYIENQNIILKIWNIDPMLNHALGFAIGENLLDYNNSKYCLTNKGINFMDKIIDSKLFDNDIEYLRSLGKKITEVTISAIVESWK